MDQIIRAVRKIKRWERESAEIILDLQEANKALLNHLKSLEEKIGEDKMKELGLYKFMTSKVTKRNLSTIKRNVKDMTVRTLNIDKDIHLIREEWVETYDIEDIKVARALKESRDKRKLEETETGDEDA